MYTLFWTAFVIILVLSGIMFCIGINNTRRQHEQLLRYWQIYQGMPEFEMLSIMGYGYSRSLLKNNRTKYEWRINAISHSSSFKGYSVRSYSGVKKVTVYVQNGYVEEVKTLNI